MDNIIEILCTRLSFSRNQLEAYARTCPYRYKVYTIKKRDGVGKRIIAQPSKDLKAVQRILLEEFLNDKLPVHSCATAYRSGKSILHNAQPHLKNSFLLKMDFKDFFPSITAEDFLLYLSRAELVTDPLQQKILAWIFFRQDAGDLRLSIGSPGSPHISNALLYDFDDLTLSYCEAEDVIFTRYSDDLTFSTNHKDKLFSWPQKVAAALKSIASPKLSLNEKKTVFSSKKFNRHVTGITITNEAKASLGRARKRKIRTRVYLVSRENVKELELLKGTVAFARSIEPQFVNMLRKKYPAQMKLILSYRSDKVPPLI